MLHHYTKNISIYYEKDEYWMVEEVEKIGEKLIQKGLEQTNKMSLFALFESYTDRKDVHILYGKMFPKIISYISRLHYKIISTNPFQLEKYK